MENRITKRSNNDTEILLWTSVAHFFNHIGNYLTPGIIIFLQEDIPLTHTEEGILFTIPMIMMVLFSILSGYLGDKQPLLKKMLIWIGILGIGLFAFLMSFSTTFTDIAIATIILGVALSIFHPLAFTYLNSMPDKDKNMGINAVFGNFGSAITPLIAMLLSVIFDWRAALLCFAFVIILFGISFALFFPNDPSLHQKMNDYTENGILTEKKFTEKQIILLLALLALISALRAPIFRCISVFTTIVFNSAFAFDKVESSILGAIILGIGASAVGMTGYYNNKKAKRSIYRNERIRFRTNTLLLSSGMATIMLIFLVLIPQNEAFILMINYLLLTLFFFIGASVIPTISIEITGAKGMGTAFGILFTGATLTGAIAPTVFGYLADEYGFNISFVFLMIIAVICFFSILLFKRIYNVYSQ